MEDEGGTAAASACASGTGSDGRKGCVCMRTGTHATFKAWCTQNSTELTQSLDLLSDPCCMCSTHSLLSPLLPDSSDGSRMSFVRYIFAEVSRGYLMEYEEDEYTEKQRRVLTFMKTPRELEKVSS